MTILYSKVTQHLRTIRASFNKSMAGKVACRTGDVRVLFQSAKTSGFNNFQKAIAGCARFMPREGPNGGFG